MPAMKPEECDLLMSQAFRNKNIEDILSLYEKDGVLVLDNAKPATGYREIREALQPYMAAEEFELIAEPVAFLSAKGDIALTRAAWSAKIKGEDGSISNVSGKSVAIVRRQPNGTWLFVLDHPNGAD
jgi:ketosteroid isomerase-like protein